MGDILPDIYRELFNLDILKNRIRKWKPESCPSQSAITCSKLTIETLEQGVKYVQS